MRGFKLFFGILITITVLTVLTLMTYLWILPKLVSNEHVLDFIEDNVEKSLNIDLDIENPKLSTSLKPTINFSVDEISIEKNDINIFELKNLDTQISFNNLLQKSIKIDRILADEIFVDSYKLISILPKQEEQKETKAPDFNIDFYSTILGVKKCFITYDSPEIFIKFDSKNMLLDRSKIKKYLHFDFDFEMKKGNDRILVSANDKNKIYMGNGELHIDKFPIEIDNSTVIIDAFAARKKGYELNISSKHFNAKDIYNIAASNIIIPNGKELLAPICDVKGNVDFNLNLTKNNIRGNINVNESEFKIKDLLKLPVKITQGIVEIGNKDITLKDFKGYYNNKKENSIVMSGDIKDYWKTCDTKIVSDIFVNNDFFVNYVSKMLNAPIGLVGDAGSRLTLTSKNGSCDVVWYFLLKENEGFLLGGESMVLKKYQTLFKIDLSVVKNILKINTIDYYITNELKKGMTPVLAINGNIDMANNMKLLDLNLNIPRPLPSEFLNFLACQKIFRKGTISGNLSIDNKGEFPKMAGVISLDKVFIPAQRLFIKSAKIGAKGDKLGAIASGRYKRTKYDFSGYIVNDLRLPIVVKNVNLTVDNVDVERMLLANSSNQHTTEPAKEVLADTSSTEEISEESLGNDNTPTFTKGLIIVEKCALNLVKGKYKSVDFGNLQANLTLDKDGILNIQSNRFDIAKGISTLKVNADLIKQKYYLRLGIKDVDSDVMATAILGLPREISGKASGLIELNSDASLKLNGNIKFAIKNGTIEKIGYVQYLLNFASIFRNPLAMISPATFSDLVTIPDGRFEKISGDLILKDNVISLIKIKSSAELLSTFIIGRYDLMTNDATLRIYTKMSNKGEGFAGFLRNLSLNSLANRISDSGRNDANYYSSEISQLPDINADEKDCQIFLTKVDGDIINFNFLSYLKRIK